MINIMWGKPAAMTTGHIAMMLLLVVYKVHCVDHCRRDADIPEARNCPVCATRCNETATESHACSCDENCLRYGDCCADFSQSCYPKLGAARHDASSGPAIMPTRCKGFSRIRSGRSFPFATLLISGCLDGRPCEEGNIDKGVNYAVPVMDRTSGLHYMNGKCAVCNSVEEALPWNASLHCVSTSKDAATPIIESEQDLLDRIRSGYCRLSFDTPFQPAVRTCFPGAISRCNPTCENKALVQLCETGPTAYTSAGFVVYRNLYCALCSGNNDAICEYYDVVAQSNPPSQFWSFSLSLVFDFDPRKGVEVGREEPSPPKCSPGSTWIPNESRCRLQTCPPGWLVVEHNCLQSVFNATAHFIVKFINSKHVTLALEQMVQEGNAMREAMEQAIEQLLVLGETDVLPFSVGVINANSITVNITFTYSHENNSTWNGTGLLTDKDKLGEIMADRLVTMFETMGIDPSSFIVSLQSFDTSLLTDDHTNQCTWVTYNATQYVIENGTLFLLEENNASYSDARYRVIGDIAYVCVATLEGPGIQLEFTPALNIVACVFTVLSILCLFCRLVLQYFVAYFRSFAGRLHFNLCLSLFLAYTFLIIGGVVANTEERTLCLVIGVLTYLMFLATFGWTSAITFNTWTALRPSARFVKRDDSTQSIVPYALVGWLVPVIFALVVLALDFTDIDTHHRPNFGKHLCWINQRYALLFYFGIPVGLSLLGNCIWFALSVHTLRKALRATLKATTMPSKESHRLGIYVRLFILMGMSWTIGFIAAFTGVQALWIVFTVLNASQGIFLFISFVCRKAVFQTLFTHREECSQTRSTGLTPNNIYPLKKREM